MKKSKMIFSVLVIILILTSVLVYLSPCFLKHRYYNNLPNYWHILGVPEKDGDISDSYQCAVTGHFYGNETLYTITNFHHGRVGIFLHKFSNGKWIRSVLDQLFNPNNEYGWRVKGLVSGDVDGDGYPEIVTAADAVKYPYGSSLRRPFPGAIYIDLNNGEPIIQPLIWGKWGEKIANDSLSIMIPKIITPKFRDPENPQADILVKTGTEVDGAIGSRVFLLEQPLGGFGNYNFTYITPTLRGDEPYETEAFYVKHFYVEEGDGNLSTLKEMTFSPKDFVGATTAMVADAEPIDFDNDNLVDLVVSVEYYNSVNALVGGRVYAFKRISSQSYKFLFEELQKIEVPYASFGFMRKANLNGDQSDGKESIVVGFYSNSTVKKHLAGPAYLTWNGTGLEIHYLESKIRYPYKSVYGYLLATDINNDGYDDIIEYLQEGSYTGGDLILFLNTKNNSGAKFVYDKTHVKILMKGQWLTWFMAIEQADDDLELELVVCLINQLPYWCPIGNKIRSAYYVDIFTLIQENRFPSP